MTAVMQARAGDTVRIEGVVREAKIFSGNASESSWYSVKIGEGSDSNIIKVLRSQVVDVIPQKFERDQRVVHVSSKEEGVVVATDGDQVWVKMDRNGNGVILNRYSLEKI